eukprot:gene29548-38591_t
METPPPPSPTGGTTATRGKAKVEPVKELAARLHLRFREARRLYNAAGGD